MTIIFFVHPDFLNSQSMPRFAGMIADGMHTRGHSVLTWSPKPLFYRLPFPQNIKKWMGYIDQYVIFPRQVKLRLKNFKKDVIFVFTDNALGPWVPLVSNQPHVIHCHDFLAQRSGLGEIPENMTGWTGKLYQKFIRSGYRTGKNFISVSQKTKEDLNRFLNNAPSTSEVVYNGLNQNYTRLDKKDAACLLSDIFEIDLKEGFILHVGGNQWYKNRIGVIEIYNCWRETNKLNIPLLLIGEKPSQAIYSTYKVSPFKDDIHFISGVADENVRLAYAAASVFLFPSIAEGFGWPIAEAMASGCPVITTGEKPMSEVAGDAAFQIRVRPQNSEDILMWACQSAKMLDEVLSLSIEARNSIINKGNANILRFNPADTLDRIEFIYIDILRSFNHQ